MQTKFLTPLNLIRDFIVNILAGIATGGIIVSHNLLLGIIIFILMVIVGTIYLVFIKYERLIKVIWSGAQGYYYSFPPEENPKVWKETKEIFKYMGVSSDAILLYFKEWVGSLPSSSPCKFYFLLANPEGESLKRQIAHQKNLPMDDERVINEVAVIQERIRTSIMSLKNLEISKNIEIKIYDEFIPWWMYILDEKKIYLGILPKGQSGLYSPVLVMKQTIKYTTIFDSFSATWDRMWEKATDA